MDRRAQETNETLMLEVQVREADEAIKIFVFGQLYFMLKYYVRNVVLYQFVGHLAV